MSSAADMLNVGRNGPWQRGYYAPLPRVTLVAVVPEGLTCRLQVEQVNKLDCWQTLAEQWAGATRAQDGTRCRWAGDEGGFLANNAQEAALGRR